MSGLQGTKSCASEDLRPILEEVDAVHRAGLGSLHVLVELRLRCEGEVLVEAVAHLDLAGAVDVGLVPFHDPQVREDGCAGPAPDALRMVVVDEECCHVYPSPARKMETLYKSFRMLRWPSRRP